jgi:hypothetical protein
MTTQGITWKPGPSYLADQLEKVYHSRVIAAVASLVVFFSAKVEAYAKANAPWTDRTGNARQSLFAVTDLAEDTITLYLSHGMDYGKWLELCNQGKYAIILPALQAHYHEFMQAVKDLLA